MTILIDGRKMRDEILSRLKERVARLATKPVFCDILVGDDGASAQYVRMKNKTAENLGIEVIHTVFPSDVTTQKILFEIDRLNKLPNMSGLIVQLPLPAALDKRAILDAVDASIDVDCTGSVVSELFYTGKNSLIFPTARAVITILDSLNLDLAKEKIVVLGKGELVGKPVTYLLRSRGLEVSVIDRSTLNPEELLKSATVIISATGRGQFIKGDMINEGAVVIDAGTSESNGGVVGDVDFETVSKKARALSPVPGGVGPMTVAMLFDNVVTVAELKSKSYVK